MVDAPRRGRGWFVIVLTALIAAGAAAGGVALLVNIWERKSEARNPFYRVVELTDETVDPAIWGKNFPLQFDGYRRTVDQVRTRYGGSEAVPRTPTRADPRSIVAQSRLEEDRASRRCGPATRSPATSGRSAATPTCSTTRPTPSGSRR
jgi:nitrite reductase (cytochrome c-552)